MITNLIKPNAGYKILPGIFIFCLLLVSVSSSGQISPNKDYQSGIEKFELCQFDSAIVYYSKAEQKSMKEKNLDDAISAQIRLAEVYCEIAQYDTMWTLVGKIKKLIINEDSSMDYLHFDLSTLLTGIYVTFAQPDSAKYYMVDAAKLLEKITEPYLKANYYYQCAQYYKFFFNSKKANACLDYALQLYPHISLLFKAKCFAVKQKLAYMNKDYDTQRRLNEHITFILDSLKIDVHPLLAKVYESYGLIDLDNWKYFEVDECFTKSNQILKKFYPELSPEIGWAYNQLGISNSWIKKDSLSLEFHRKSLKIRIKLFGADNYNTTFSYTNLGNYYSRKNIDTAFYFYEKVVNIRSHVLGLKHPKLANAYFKLANLYFNNKDPWKAYKYAHLTLCASHPTFNDTSNIFQSPVIGNFYNNEALLAVTLKYAIIISNINTDSTFASLFMLKTGLECLRKMDTLQMNAPINGKYTDEIILKNRSESFFHTYAILAHLYLKTGDKEYCNQMLEFMDKCKAIQLSNELNLLPYNNGKDIHTIKNLKYECFSLQKKLAIEKLSNPEKTKMKQTKLLYEDSISCIETRMYNKFDYNYFKSNQTVKIDSLQKKMKPGDAIISYSSLNSEQTTCLIVTKDSASFYWSFPSINSTIKTFIILSNHKQENFSTLMGETAFKIYENLFPKEILNLLDLEKINNLIIIPDQNLWLVSFESLLTEKVNNETSDFASLPYLIKKYRISYAPSYYFAYQSLLHSKQIKYNKDILLVAPVFDNEKTASISSETRGFINNLNNLATDSLFEAEKLISRGNIVALPYSAFETQSIKKYFSLKRFNPEILLRHKASFQNLTSKPLNYRIIHIASHAYANTINPDLSGILLSSENSKSENILFGGQIKNMEINADLVVLSACETGLGRVVAGEGINNLSRSFAISKVPNVISSLWKVADQSTSELMLDFYEDLLKHKFSSYSESLHRAKLKMIQEGKYAQPFYWAPFVLTRY